MAETNKVDSAENLPKEVKLPCGCIYQRSRLDVDKKSTNANTINAKEPQNALTDPRQNV